MRNKSAGGGDPHVFRHRRSCSDDRGVPIVRHKAQTPSQRDQGPDFLDRAEDLWESFLSGRAPVRRPRNVPLAEQRTEKRERRRKETYERKSSSKKTSGFQSFFRDGMVRTALLVCAFVIVGSVIAIPTAFAQPTTDITINDGGRILSVSTAAQTVGQCLSDNKIQVGEGDMLAQDANAAITPGMEIKIWRAVNVTVTSGDSSTELRMVSGTVGDALTAAGVQPAGLDEVYPSLDTPIRAGMRIDHISVTKDETRHAYDIPYEKIEREDPTLAEGKTKVVQQGEAGEFEIVTEIIYKNGVVYSQKILSEETIKEPVDEIVAVGTYVPPPPEVETPTLNEIHTQNEAVPSATPDEDDSADDGSGPNGSGSEDGSGNPDGENGSGSSNGQGGSDNQGGSPGSGDNPGGDTPTPGNESIDGMDVKYSLDMQVTAYCKACDSGSGKTASGTYPQWGTVAADTGVLPFGTKIYVPGYGYGVIEDTGGFPSNVIDVYLGDRDVCTCGRDWGRRNLTIYVLN